MAANPPVSLWPDPLALGPVTDLYQLTMMAGYHEARIDSVPATFELFVRRLPAHRAYLVFAGLEQAIQDLLRMAFSPQQVDGIRRLPAFRHVDPSWFDALAGFRFTGNIDAVPEGTVVFAGEPLVRVEAPLAQAQLVETYLISSLNYPTLVASKAARLVEAARGRPLYDFGARRGHGPYAGLVCSRASYVAGFAGTAHVEAALRLGIPCVGTMAHSWVEAFPTESEAFAAFARVFPDTTTLLVDTYDTEEGVRHATAIEPPARAIRLDSGDHATVSRRAREILDARDRRETQIICSSDLDEWRIDRLLAGGAPIDAFGVGTELITSRDAPALSMVYKLVALDGVGKVKLSPGKRSYPLAKQVWRRRDGKGVIAGDHVARADETVAGEPLLGPVVRHGALVGALPDLAAIRNHGRDQVAALPANLRGADATGVYPLSYSAALDEAAARLGLL